MANGATGAPGDTGGAPGDTEPAAGHPRPVALELRAPRLMAARRVELSNLESWMKKNLTQQDEVVLEMTTNTWQLYDELVEYAGSVTVVHPPHVALITRSQVTPAPTAGAV